MMESYGQIGTVATVGAPMKSAGMARVLRRGSNNFEAKGPPQEPSRALLLEQAEHREDHRDCWSHRGSTGVWQDQRCRVAPPELGARWLAGGANSGALAKATLRLAGSSIRSRSRSQAGQRTLCLCDRGRGRDDTGAWRSHGNRQRFDFPGGELWGEVDRRRDPDDRERCMQGAARHRVWMVRRGVLR